MAELGFRTVVAAAALALGLAGGGAFAGAAQDRIFALAVLDDIPIGDQIVFDHAREVGVATDRLQEIADGRVEISLFESEDGRRQAQVTFFDDPRERRLNPFPADGGNPLLMVFMETAVQGMAALTGGSPIYIRNRMRDAVRNQDDGGPVGLVYQGRPVEGERFTFRPFLTDPNRDRMGPFAELEISFVVSEDVPGTYAALSARTAPSEGGRHLLAETMVLRGVEISE